MNPVRNTSGENGGTMGKNSIINNPDRNKFLNGATGVKILLVYPKFPETFWSFKHALKFISKKAVNPPLGLLTVASMLPKEWEKKLVDMNVTSLKDKDLKWANFVFISAMAIQKESVKEIIIRCKKMGIKIVAGGSLFTSNHNEFKEIDHLVLNEAEITLPLLLEDLKNGCAKHIYTSPMGRYKEDTYPKLGTYQYEKICFDEHSVFERLSL